MSIKDFLLRKTLEAKLKDVPKEEQEKMVKLVQDNPEFFQKVALEIQEKVKAGQDQMSAAMEVMEKYKGEIKF
jgi:hypothetical protein